MIVSVCDFLALVKDFALNYQFCPRCGCADDVYYRSELSDICLCDHCFFDEEIPQCENYENWAVNIAVRAVCDTDIKIVKECVSKCC